MFSISGRGAVVTGRIGADVVNVGEEIEIVGLKETTKTTCTGVEMFRKLLDQGEAGDNVGVLLRYKREELSEVRFWLNLVRLHRTRSSNVKLMCDQGEGGRLPFSRTIVHSSVPTTDVTGSVELLTGTEMVMPEITLR